MVQREVDARLDTLTGCRGGPYAEMGNILLRSLSAKARKVSYKEDKFVRPIEQGLPYEDIFYLTLEVRSQDEPTNPRVVKHRWRHPQ